MRQDVYRVAYDEARTELVDIAARFEQLRIRKERLEAVIAVVGPMLGMDALGRGVAGEQQLLPAPMEAEHTPDAMSYTFNQIPVPLPAAPPAADESDNDPFKRRVRNALKFKAGSADRGLQTAV